MVRCSAVAATCWLFIDSLCVCTVQYIYYSGLRIFEYLYNLSPPQKNPFLSCPFFLWALIHQCELLTPCLTAISMACEFRSEAFDTRWLNSISLCIVLVIYMRDFAEIPAVHVEGPLETHSLAPPPSTNPCTIWIFDSFALVLPVNLEYEYFVYK